MKNVLLLFVAVILFSCSSNSDKKTDKDTETTSSISEDESTDEAEETDEDEGSTCGFEDGSYSADVDYTNFETGYSATYTLDIDVTDCQVVQIHFANGGWLDESHISAGDLDEDGNATLEGEGKTYEVHIDN